LLFSGSGYAARVRIEIMKEQILAECSARGTCPLDRKQFDETFAGHDLTIQVRSALDFAQNHDLALGRSAGDQHFVFYRLHKAPENGRPLGQRQQNKPSQRRKRRSHGQKKPQGAASRPYGRSF
jgi:hypothetical protein